MAGRSVVIAGAGSAIGRASTVAFAREGAAVLAVDPDPAAVRATADAARGCRGSVEPLVAELVGEAGPATVAAWCEERWSRLDVLFTCHGRLDHEPAGEQTLAHWEEIVRTNLLGPIAYTRALLPLLASSGGGAVVYLTSIDGQYGNPRFPGYSVSKGALIPLTHVMASEGAASGVRVNAIAMAAMVPVGSTDPVPIEIPEASRAAVARATPLGRPATPDDVANAAVFLASDGAAYITGAVLSVDGGRTAITPGTMDPAIHHEDPLPSIDPPA